MLAFFFRLHSVLISAPVFFWALGRRKIMQNERPKPLIKYNSHGTAPKSPQTQQWSQRETATS